MIHQIQTPDIINYLSSCATAQICWLKSCQILRPGHAADGAIAKYPDQSGVMPYFSNYAATAMLEDPSCCPMVERYLDWYLRSLEGDGTILDYSYGSNLDFKTARPDSEDAYAGTFLALACLYHKKAGQAGWIKKSLPALKKVAGSIINLMDRDGLTFALAGYKVKYLMDNCEAYRGLADFAALLQSQGDREASYFGSMAEEIAGGIERNLWNKRKSCYYASKIGWLSRGTNLNKFYPDAACQVFPVLCGLIEANGDRGTSLYMLFNNGQPNWPNIVPPHYPWMLLGLYACLHGDYNRAYEKIRFVRKAYIDKDPGKWYCAEAAFFIITCARLLQDRDQWLSA
jgi:hypothetical protein